MDTFVVFGSRDNRSFVICATSKATNPLTVPIETNVGAVSGISPDLAPIRGALRGLVIRVWPRWRSFRLFRRQLALGRRAIPPSTSASASASAALSTEGFDSIVDDVCDSYLDGCSVFFGISEHSDSDIDFSSVGSVEIPVRPAGMETRLVEFTPSHDAGKDIDVNNIHLMYGPEGNS